MSAPQRRIRISRGNRKVGRIASVSLTPVVACAAGVPCVAACYACRMLRGRYGQNVGAAWAANLDYLRQAPASFFADLHTYLRRRRIPGMFRYHIGGDFINADHLRRAFDLARLLPAVRFLAFSKRFDLFPQDPSAVPASFALVASGWAGWADPPAGYPVAWMRDPAAQDPRIPPAALPCPGGCDTCGMCWNLRALSADVVLELH